MKVLLEITLKLLVVEKIPPQFWAKDLIVLVPAIKVSVAVQLVKLLVVLARLQAPPFN